MDAELTTRRRWRSRLFALDDVRCRPSHSGCSHEESAPADLLVFPRAGLFVRHVGPAGREPSVGDPTRLLFFRRGESYRVSHPVAGGDDCSTLAFAPALLAEAFADRAGCADSHGPTAGGWDVAIPPQVAALVQALRRALAAAEELEPKREPGLEIDERALELLACVAREVAARRAQGASAGGRTARPATRVATRRVHRELADGARLLLAAQFRERVGLAGLARSLHVSPFHLARLFRRETGRPLHAHLLELRLRAALEALAGGAADLSRLALALGFSSHAHFTDSFRRLFGVSPSRFRAAISARALLETSRKLEAAARSRT